jgi:hypothetical protein
VIAATAEIVTPCAVLQNLLTCIGMAFQIDTKKNG